MNSYLQKVSLMVEQWRAQAPVYLEGETDPHAPGHPSPVLGDELKSPHVSSKALFSLPVVAHSLTSR